MKYCSKCGKELFDEAVLCPQCGCAVDGVAVPRQGLTGLQIAARIFMVLGCLSNIGLGYGVYDWAGLISLCWTIPMTVHYFRATRAGRPVGTAFKVCSLLFVNLIAGVLMFCDKRND